MNIVSSGFALFTITLWSLIVLFYLFGSTNENTEPFLVDRLAFSGKEGRSLVIGHAGGCFKELQQLIKSSNYVDMKDKLIFVGDMIGSCPSSSQVVQFAMDHEGDCVRGPVEDLLVAWHIAGDEKKPMLTEEQKLISEQLTEDQLDYLLSCSLYIELSESKTLILHEGLNPINELGPQSEDLLKQIGQNQGIISSKLHAWVPKWDGQELVIFSSDNEDDLFLKYSSKKELVAVNMNSDVENGNFLSAFAIPEMKILQTPARKMKRK